MSTQSSQNPPAKLDGTTYGLGLLLVIMAGFTTWDQSDIWSTKDDYGFGYLVPIFSAYVFWDRWDELRAWLTGQRTEVSPPTHRFTSFIVYGVAMASLSVFALGAATRAIFGTGVLPTLAISFGFMFTALSFTFISVRGPEGIAAPCRAHWRAVNLMIFPAGVWLISGPFLYLVDNRIKGTLLTSVTGIVSGILRVFDHVIRVNGNTIIFANGDAVGVAEACSGIRSLSACVFAGAFLGAIFIEGSFWGQLIRRITLIGLAGITAILLNIGRNTFLTFYALNHGSKSLERDLAGIEHGQPNFSSWGTIHDLAGNVAMVAALLLLVSFVPLLNRFGRTDTSLPES